jgi:hypothetical protein
MQFINKKINGQKGVRGQKEEGAGGDEHLLVSGKASPVQGGQSPPAHKADEDEVGEDGGIGLATVFGELALQKEVHVAGKKNHNKEGNDVLFVEFFAAPKGYGVYKLNCAEQGQASAKEKGVVIAELQQSVGQDRKK